MIFGQEKLKLYSHNSMYQTSFNVGTGRWHHVVASYGYATPTIIQIKLYIDGRLLYSTTAPGSASYPSFNSAGTVIGQDQDTVLGGYDRTQAYDGLIDELAVFNKSLTASEVSYLYNGGNGRSACS